MIIAGTGHRPTKLGGYSKDAFNLLVAIAKLILLKKKPDRVITGMALGWDQALAEACIILGIPFTAAVPFIGQELNWPLSSQKYYKELLHKADLIEIISPGGYAPHKMQVRNEWMVDQLGEEDLLLTMYDGTTGGTHNCIEYAKRTSHCQILNVYNMLKK